jgi:hypothetical protein
MQSLEDLDRHLVRRRGVACALEEDALHALEQRPHRGVERVQPFVQPQDVKLLAPLLDDLRDRRADAAAFVAQQGEQADGRTAQLCRNVDERRDLQRRLLSTTSQQTIVTLSRPSPSASNGRRRDSRDPRPLRGRAAAITPTGTFK